LETDTRSLGILSGSAFLVVIDRIPFAFPGRGHPRLTDRGYNLLEFPVPTTPPFVNLFGGEIPSDTCHRFAFTWFCLPGAELAQSCQLSPP
jgi:hypothetical protein